MLQTAHRAPVALFIRTNCDALVAMFNEKGIAKIHDRAGRGLEHRYEIEYRGSQVRNTLTKLSALGVELELIRQHGAWVRVAHTNPINN